MSKEPIISLIVLCYNYGQFLKECLDSVFAQKGQDAFEVILIDDASVDNTPVIAQGYMPDPRFTYIRHERNQGHIYSANEGLSRSRGRYVMRVDADDYLAEDCLRKLIDIADRYPEVGLVYGNIRAVDASSRIISGPMDVIHRGADFKGTEIKPLLFTNFLCVSAVMIKRCAWERIGFSYDEKVPFSEDWWIYLRIGLRYQFYYINDVLAYYRLHEGSIRRGLLESFQAERSIRYILEHFFALRDLPDDVLRLKKKVFAKQLAWFADQYFNLDKHSDARRCLRECAAWRWQYLVSAYWWKRYLLSCLSPQQCKVLKKTLQMLIKEGI